MKASLKRVVSILRLSDSWMWIIDACENAASSLCVEWVANTSVWSARGWPRGTPIAWRPS